MPSVPEPGLPPHPGVPADQAERELAVYDLSRAYCVEAAAGTGKTTLLVDRLLHLVRTGKAELNDVAAITFTEKAAAELKIRLREELEERRKTATDPEERRRFARGLEQLDHARISTIHAFAASLLRERPVEAAIDPGFEQLDEMGSQLLLDEAWQRWKEEQLADPPPVLRRLMTLEIGLEKVKVTALHVLRNRDLAWLSSPAPEPNPIHEIWDEAAALVRQLQALAACCRDTSDRGYAQIQQLANLVAHTGSGDLSRERVLLLDAQVDLRAGARGKWSPASACDQQKQICRDLRAVLDAAPKRLGPSLMAEMREWLAGFLQAVESEKRRRGVLDFQDLLLKARDLLRGHLEVRAYFQRRIRFLLVDEFQDTDPLQAEIVFFLAEQEAKAKDWRHIVLAPDKLFLVGDPKQSIYRFRRADMRIYAMARRMLGTLHEPLVLRQNFRSSRWVLQAINGLFRAQMQADEHQAEYVDLEPAPERAGMEPGLALLFPPEGSTAKNMDEYWQTEAGLVARFLKHICATPESPVRIWDKARQAVRPPAFGDIAVLFPVTAGLAEYEAALRACGVPFQADAGHNFYARRETRDLISVLTAIDDPEDALALVAALRSPFFGLSDADLFLYGHAGGDLHYLRKLAAGFPRMAESLGELRRWHELRPVLSLAALVDAVLNESCVLSFLLLLPDGELAVANLLRIVELARGFEKESGGGLRSFLRWLEQRAASELAGTEAGLGGEDDNSVHLLTIHAAKGLEFPVVALAGMACAQHQAKDVLADYAGGQIALSLTCGGQRMISRNFAPLAEDEQRRGRAEDLRLFYVAATRAMDCLIVPRLAPENQKTRRFLDFLRPLDVYGGRPEQTVCVEGVLRFRAEDLPEMECSSTVFLHDVGRLAPDPQRLSAMVAGREEWKAGLETLGVSAAGAEDGAGAQAATPRAADSLAAALGTVFHRIMSQVLSAEDGSAAAIIENAAAGAGVSAHAALLRDWVERTLSSPLLARARKAAQAWRELPFCVPYQGQIREGCIDLLFAEGGNLVLVDYKTDAVEAAQLPEAAEMHRPQLDLYREAVKQITGSYPGEAVIYFVRPGLAFRLEP